MKVLSDKSVIETLNKTLTKQSILDTYQSTLLKSLKVFAKNPDGIVPARTVQQSNNPTSDTTHLFMPCIAPEEVGIKIVSGGEQNNKKGLGFQGGVLVLNEISGEVEGLVSANTLTAFRTALASTLGLTKVISLDDGPLLPGITVFGVGRQAYWHVKLALILYGDRVSTVNVVNRSLDNAVKFAHKIKEEFNINTNAYLFQNPSTDMVKSIQQSSIIFGCLPTTESPIRKEYINPDPKYPKLIALIGSYKPHMIELDAGFITEEIKDKVKIIVDSKEHTLHEAGELIQSGITKDGLVELTELYEDDVKVTTCNNVTLQKLVGLSIMDISIAKKLLDLGEVAEIDFS